MSLIFIKLIIFYLALSFAGKQLLRLCNITELDFYKNQLGVVKANFSAIIFLALFVLVNHLVSLVTGSLSVGFYTTSLLGVLFIAYSLVKYGSSLDFSSKNIITNATLAGFAATVAYSYFLKDAVYSGSGDCILHAVTSCFIENDFYPPLKPDNFDVDLSFYHYGTNLIEAIIQKVCNTQIWDTMSLQNAFCSYSCFLSLVFLLNVFIKDNQRSILFSVLVTFFTSFNFIEYALLHSKQFSAFVDRYSFLEFSSALNSMSIKSVAKRITYYGWGLGFSFLFPFLSLAAGFFKQQSKALMGLLFVASFALYFNYPAMWYPCIAGLAILVGYQFITNSKPLVEKIKETEIQYPIVLMFLLVASKVLTFTGSSTGEEGISILKLAPQLHTPIWDVAYLNLFESKEYIQSLYTKFDPYESRKYLNIPLFSGISFREFGSILIPALGAFAYKIYNRNKLDFKEALLAAGCVGLAFPYIFEFTVRPIESHRFMVIGKALALSYLVIFIANKLQNNLKNNSILLSLVLLLSLPGFSQIWVLGKTEPTQVKPPLFSEDFKLLITELQKIHKPGLITLDNQEHPYGPQMSSFAGFYSKEGEFMRLPNQTRHLALQTLNPFLLKEMSVNLLVINPSIQNFNIENLQDKDLFTRVQLSANLKWLVFEFNNNFDVNKYSHLKDEYTWALMFEDKKHLAPIMQGDQMITSQSRGEVNQFKQKMLNKLKKQGTAVALWTKARAIQSPGNAL